MAWQAPAPSTEAESRDSSGRASVTINELAHRFKSNVHSPEDGVSSNYLAVLQRENEKVRAEEAAQSAASDLKERSNAAPGHQFTPSALPQSVPINNSSRSGNSRSTSTSNSNSNSGKSDSASSNARSATSPLYVCRDAIGTPPHADRPWLEGVEDVGANGGRRGSVLTAPADALTSIGKSLGKSLRGALLSDSNATGTRAPTNSPRRVEQLRQRLLIVKQDMKREMYSTADAAATLARRAAYGTEERFEELNRLTAWGLGVCVPDVGMAWDLRLLRLQLLRDGAARALWVLADRRNEAAQLAETSLASDKLARLAGDPQACGLLCQTAGELLAGDEVLQALVKRIGYATRALHLALQRAEQHIPRLEPKNRTHRAAMLLEVIDKHQELEAHRQRLFDGAKVGCDHALRCSGLLGLDGNKGAKDEHRRRKIERKFLETAADQRTREGRLLSRWCDMTNANVLKYESSATSSMSANGGAPAERRGSGIVIGGAPAERRGSGIVVGGAAGDRRGSGIIIGSVVGDRRGSGIIIGGGSSDEQRARGFEGAPSQTMPPTGAQPNTVSTDLHGANAVASASTTSASVEPPASDTQLHPRSLLAFCDYWADAVLNESLELNAAPGTPRGEALMELSTALVFRTIHPTVFAFVHKAAGSKERDRRWRRKARRMRCLSAIEAGVPPEYLRSSIKPSNQVTSPVQTPQSSNKVSSNASSNHLGTSSPSLNPNNGDPSIARSRVESDFSGIESVQMSVDAPSSASARLAKEATAESTTPSRATEETSTTATPPPPAEAEAPAVPVVASVQEGGGGSGDRKIDGARPLKMYSVPSSTLPAAEIRRGLMSIDFWRTARVFSRLTGCVVPWEALHWFMAGMRMLHAEAKLIPDSKPLNADTMFPILTWALVHAELPRLHSVLFFLRHFALSAFVAAEEAAGRSGNAPGEVDYYLTCTEAAVSHVLSLDVGAYAEAACAGADSDEEAEDAPDDEQRVTALAARGDEIAVDASVVALANASAANNGSSYGSADADNSEEIDSEICAEARNLLLEEQSVVSRGETPSDLRRSVPIADIRNAVDISSLEHASANKAPLLPNDSTAVHQHFPSQTMSDPHLVPPHTSTAKPPSTESGRNNSTDSQFEKSNGLQRIANGFLGMFSPMSGAAAEGSTPKSANSAGGAASAEESPADPAMDENSAMEKLGSWLGAQQAMEDTIDVLEQEGWMA